MTVDRPLRIVVPPDIWEKAAANGPEMVEALREMVGIMQKACDIANALPPDQRAESFHRSMAEMTGSEPEVLDEEAFDELPDEAKEALTRKPPEVH